MTSQTREERSPLHPALNDATQAPVKKAANLTKVLILLTALMLSGAVQPAAAAVVGAPRTVSARALAAVERVIEVGKATWYGRLHSKHYTVSGERFDPSKLTAAHRNIPIGTMVRVTDRSTGRSVVVKVNDREPPHGIRCIDLSEGAARALGIRSEGVADVVISAIAAPAPVEVAEAPDDAVAPGAIAARVRLQPRHAGP